MGSKTSIEWTKSEDGSDGATWTPIRARNNSTGKIGWHCEHATTGCEFCYAEGMNKRLGTGLPFKPGHRMDVDIFLDEEMLYAPLRWKKPRKIFVCSMTDLFADFVLNGWIMRMFNVMWQCPRHTFQICTKRPERMRAFMTQWGDLKGEDFKPKLACGPQASRKAHPSGRGQLYADMLETMGEPPDGFAFPTFDWMGGMIGWPAYPLNVWLGVSAEQQREWDNRIKHLGATPAAIRFVSAEPLLGPIDCGNAFDPSCDNSPYQPIDWVIVGGESGPRARAMKPEWARSLRDQCAEADVPFFYKQTGEWQDADVVALEATNMRRQIPLNYYEAAKVAGKRRYEHHSDGTTMIRVGKKAAGRLLDGRLHSGMPT